jgi:hypothetical protein
MWPGVALLAGRFLLRARWVTERNEVPGLSPPKEFLRKAKMWRV